MSRVYYGVTGMWSATRPAAGQDDDDGAGAGAGAGRDWKADGAGVGT